MVAVDVDLAWTFGCVSLTKLTPSTACQSIPTHTCLWGKAASG